MHNPQLYPLFIFGTFILTAFAVIILVVIVIQKQRQVKNRLEKQQREFDYNNLLLNTRLEVQESSLNQVAGELHDNVAQVLTAAYYQLSYATINIESKNASRFIADAQKTINQALTDVRLLSHSLSSGWIETRDLEIAIQSELDRIVAFSIIHCELKKSTQFELPPDKRLLTFRIIQEALQNTVKHASASNIIISMTLDSNRYIVIITDDGIGFDIDDSSFNTSMGFVSMRERSKVLGAEFNISSIKKIGTTITLKIPI